MCDPRLSPAQKILAGKIYVLSKGSGYCWASNKTLGRDLGQTGRPHMSPDRVSHNLTVLRDAGHVRIVGRTNRRKIYPQTPELQPELELPTTTGANSDSWKLSAETPSTIGANAGKLSPQTPTYKKRGSKENTPTTNGANYPPEFETLWGSYPDREGGNPKRPAYLHWRARIREGVDPPELLEGVQRYASYCERAEQAGTRFVMQAQTFLGPNERWREDYLQTHPGTEAWPLIETLVRKTPLRQLQPDDIKQLPPEARHALAALGGIPKLKQLSERQLKDAATRFYGLCREEAPR
jgi:hypothetical protein